jgi:hypothetical protein
VWSLLKPKSRECRKLRSSLEDLGDVSGLTLDLKRHLQNCSACQTAVDEFLMIPALLRGLPSRATAPAPWFVPRVMTAISAREAELRRSPDAWSILPRLAARLSWVSAVALLLTFTWLYGRPTTAPNNSNDSAFESLFDTSTSSAGPDDLLASHMETQQ